MNEAHLCNLVAHAAAAERFEHDLACASTLAGAGAPLISRAAEPAAGGAFSRFAHCTQRLAAAVIIGVGLAATAGILATSNFTHEDLPQHAAVPFASASETMLIALYRGSDGKAQQCPECWCVQRWTPKSMGPHEFAQLAHDKLIKASMSRSCVDDVEKLIVVALSGPRGTLPNSDQSARELALCLTEGTSSESNAASPGCVGSAVTVRIAQWSR